MKNVAILGPTSSEDIWNIPISFYNHFIKLGYNTRFCNTLVNNKFDEANLLLLIDDYKQNVFRPDLILHLDFGFFDSQFLDKQHIPTAKWVVESGDDPQNFHLNFKKIQNKHFDLVLSPDVRTTREYLKHNIKAVWCPYFADPDQFVDINQEPIFDAVTTRSIEEPFFKELKARLGNCFEARTNFLHGKEHSYHLKKGHIVVQNSKYKEITRRVFEGMMAQRLVITDKPDPSTEIGKLFKEDEDIVYFNSLDECVDKINFYTANPSIREAIAKKACEKVNSQHTTQKRIKTLMKLLR